MIIMSLIVWDPCTETRLAPGEAGPGDWQQPCPVGAALQLRQEARAAVAEFNGQLRRPGQGRVEPVAAGAHHLRHGLSLAQPARQGGNHSAIGPPPCAAAAPHRLMARGPRSSVISSM